MLFFKTKNLDLGFTLIELMVVITIMTILIGGAIAGFIRFSDNQKVLAAAKETQQLLRYAQSRAANAVYPTGDTTCDPDPDNNKLLQGYRVTRSASSFSLQPICGPDDGAVTAGTVIRTYTVPNGVAINSPANSTTIDFYTLQGGVDIARTFQFTATSTSRSYSFNLLITGAVSNVQ